MHTQRWMVAAWESTTDQNLAFCQSEDCVGWFSGIPPFLREQAEEEGWVLPVVWVETFEDA